MKLTREQAEELLVHAGEDVPNECCGMIGAIDGEATSVYRARNAEASPLRYNLDPADQFKIMTTMEDRGEDLAAIYHSHTKSPAYPSQTDINLAFYPEALYVIVGVAGDEPDVRAFRIVEGEVSEQPLEVVG